MSKRLTIRDIAASKSQTPLVSLTAYTAPMAQLLDPHCDILLVGDSVGMVLYGMESTLPVTLDMMIQHGRAVVNHSSNALVVVDMPFGSYQQSPQQAFASAARIMQETAAQAVKLEGGESMAETIHFLTNRGIPVMAHIGLMPQSVHQAGGYRFQGRNEEEAQQIRQDAKAVEEAGAFAVVLEGVEQQLAEEMTQIVKIPTIGIGASAQCDGQILVTEDMLGLFEKTPSFVKQYAAIRNDIDQAIVQFAHDVRKRAFPTDQHCLRKKITDTNQRKPANEG